jgi:hypothetical protein
LCGDFWDENISLSTDAYEAPVTVSPISKKRPQPMDYHTQTGDFRTTASPECTREFGAGDTPARLGHKQLHGASFHFRHDDDIIADPDGSRCWVHITGAYANR